jgi:hypothetical protein
MAQAKQPGGLYYMGDDAVDANGNKIEGAAKKPADTPREKQPGSIGVADPEARLAKAMVTELANAGMLKGASARKDAGEEVRPAHARESEPAVGATVVRPSAADRAPGASDSVAQTAIATAELAGEGAATTGTKEGSEKSARKRPARKAGARKSARKGK